MDRAHEDELCHESKLKHPQVRQNHPQVVPGPAQEANDLLLSESPLHRSDLFLGLIEL